MPAAVAARIFRSDGSPNALQNKILRYGAIRHVGTLRYDGAAARLPDAAAFTHGEAISQVVQDTVSMGEDILLPGEVKDEVVTSHCWSGQDTWRAGKVTLRVGEAISEVVRGPTRRALQSVLQATGA